MQVWIAYILGVLTIPAMILAVLFVSFMRWVAYEARLYVVMRKYRREQEEAEKHTRAVIDEMKQKIADRISDEIQAWYRRNA